MIKDTVSNRTNRSVRKPKPLTPQDNTTTLAVRCYAEQCVGGIEETLKRIMRLDRSCYSCYAIVHGKTVKIHLHIALRYHGKRPTDSVRVSRILKDLGINFREEDTIMMENRGLETLGSWTGYFVYLCHKDATSESLGKVKYEISDFVTNLNLGDFRKAMQGKLTPKRLPLSEQISVDCEEAWQAGLALWNKNSWMKSKRMEFIRYGNKYLDLIKESFDEGRNEKLKSYIPQIVICINIAQNTTLDKEDTMTIARRALTDMDMTVDKTEEKDAQDAYVRFLDTDLLTVVPVNAADDVPDDVPDIKFPYMFTLNDENFVFHNKVLSDDRTTSLEAWTYNIVIINERKDNGIRKYKNKTYYYCTIDEDEKELKFEAPCELGDDKEQNERKRLYIDFRDSFNNCLRNYVKPEANTAPPAKVDYSDLY